jgi:hypothetical protein
MVVYLKTGDCFVIAGQKREARLRTNDPAIQHLKTMDARIVPGHDERRKSGRSAKAPEADWQGAENRARMARNEQPAAP